MNNFLCKCNAIYRSVAADAKHFKNILVILSNESADLDSVISAIVYGYVLYQENLVSKQYEAVLPLLNIDRDDLVLKTESVFFLQSSRIDWGSIPTRYNAKSAIDLNKIHEAGCLKLILVDFHALPLSDENLKPSVIEVIDHRPKDPKWTWEDLPDADIRSNIGSCASLITYKIAMKWPNRLTEEVAKLLIAPIILDTFNLDVSKGRTFDLDCEMADLLQTKVKVKREILFDELSRAKFDIQCLTTQQVLRKDLKFVGKVPVAGAPILIENLCKKTGFKDDVIKFMKKVTNAQLVILIGYEMDGDSIARDIAIYSEKNALSRKIVEELINSSLNLQLVEVINHNIQSLRLFRQRNVSATRKHIVPLIRSVTEDCENVNLNSA